MAKPHSKKRSSVAQKRATASLHQCQLCKLARESKALLGSLWQSKKLLPPVILPVAAVCAICLNDGGEKFPNVQRKKIGSLRDPANSIQRASVSPGERRPRKLLSGVIDMPLGRGHLGHNTPSLIKSGQKERKGPLKTCAFFTLYGSVTLVLDMDR
jgi:hypothetical protein